MGTGTIGRGIRILVFILYGVAISAVTTWVHVRGESRARVGLNAQLEDAYQRFLVVLDEKDIDGWRPLLFGGRRNVLCFERLDGGGLDELLAAIEEVKVATRRDLVTGPIFVPDEEWGDAMLQVEPDADWGVTVVVMTNMIVPWENQEL